MNRLGILSDTEGRLVEIVRRICNRRKSGEVFDYEVTEEYNRLYERKKVSNLERRLRDLCSAGRISGGGCYIEIKGKKQPRTKYSIAQRQKVAA